MMKAVYFIYEKGKGVTAGKPYSALTTFFKEKKMSIHVFNNGLNRLKNGMEEGKLTYGVKKISIKKPEYAVEYKGFVIMHKRIVR